MALRASEHGGRLWARPGDRLVIRVHPPGRLARDVAPLVQQLRSEHEVIARGLADLKLVADTLPELSRAQSRELVRVAVALFRLVDQHALKEEHDIYPEVTRLLGHRELAAVMTHDHRALRAASAQLAGIDPLDTPRLQALLYGLHALLTAHMQKEDEIVFPMFEPPARD